jgi:hypothetical protein
MPGVAHHGDRLPHNLTLRGRSVDKTIDPFAVRSRPRTRRRWRCPDPSSPSVRGAVRHGHRGSQDHAGRSSRACVPGYRQTDRPSAPRARCGPVCPRRPCSQADPQADTHPTVSVPGLPLRRACLRRWGRGCVRTCVGQCEVASRERLHLNHLQLRELGEQRAASAVGDGADQEVVLVDEVGAHERLREAHAAVREDRAARPLGVRRSRRGTGRDGE